MTWVDISSYSASAQLAMQSAVLAMIDSVRPTVTDRLSDSVLSHADIMPKRLQLRSCGLHRRVSP